MVALSGSPCKVIQYWLYTVGLPVLVARGERFQSQEYDHVNCVSLPTAFLSNSVTDLNLMRKRATSSRVSYNELKPSNKRFSQACEQIVVNKGTSIQPQAPMSPRSETPRMMAHLFKVFFKLTLYLFPLCNFFSKHLSLPRILLGSFSSLQIFFKQRFMADILL